MANVFVNEETLTNIANSIRSKTGITTTLKPSEMPAMIKNIAVSGGIAKIGIKAYTRRSVNSNGTTTSLTVTDFFNFNVGDTGEKFLKIKVKEINRVTMKYSYSGSSLIYLYPIVKYRKVYSDGTELEVTINSDHNIPDDLIVDLTEDNLQDIYFTASQVALSSGSSDSSGSTSGTSYVDMELEFLSEV